MPNMIKTIHKYQNSILLYLIMGVVAFSMIGFGVDFGSDDGRGDRNYAIKIDDHEISHAEFERYRRSLENYYRSAYGKHYRQLLETQGWNTAQQTVDQLIPNYLLERTAGKLGLHVGPEQVRERIMAQMPGGTFNREMYLNLLRQTGMTAPEFERSVADDLLRAQLRTIISDMSRAAKAEALALLERDETAYDAAYLEFDPAAWTTKVEAPPDDKLEAYYQEHASNYERPARVAYDFIAFDPKQRLDLVEIGEDEIELYYTENQSDFMNPARAKVQAVRISIPASADQTARAELRKKADEALSKARAGEDFKALVEAYSDDMATKFNGGEFGWVTRGDGKPEKAVVNAALQLGDTGVADLVSTRHAYYVVKVAEYQAATEKPLAEVRERIERIVREREAPAWVAERANSLYEEWSNSGKSLADFAKEHSLTVESSSGLLDKTQEASKGFQGLTARVLEAPEQEKQLAESGDKLALVQVGEFKEAEVPPLAEIKDRVQQDYAQAKANELARDAAAQLVKDLGEKRYADIKEAAGKLGMELKEQKALKRNAALEPPFAEREARQALFSTYNAFAAPTSSYTSGGKYYVFQVTEIQKPDMQKLADKVDEYRERASELNAETLLASMVNDLKMQSNIDVAPRLTEER